MTTKSNIHADFIAGFDSDEYDTEAMRIDDRNGNFSPERVEDYGHHAIIMASIHNGQFSQARAQCQRFAVSYDECLRQHEANF